MSDITSRVKAIIVDKLGVDESEVTLEASFTNDFNCRSSCNIHRRLKQVIVPILWN